jgi:ABC-type multidrug transport system ATPase subunit
VTVQIQTTELSKRFQFQWVLRHVNLCLQSDHIWGIGGGNGSGKSTLVKILSGYLSPTTGDVHWQINDTSISRDMIFRHVAWSAPYTGLVYEYSLQEMFRFQSKFKPWRKNLSWAEFLDILELPAQHDKPLQYFSSGMQQKIQLALAVLADSPYLFLDEPTSYLDAQAKRWFASLLTQNMNDRLIVLASNDPFDLSLCSELLMMDQLKK